MVRNLPKAIGLALKAEIQTQKVWIPPSTPYPGCSSASHTPGTLTDLSTSIQMAHVAHQSHHSFSLSLDEASESFLTPYY